MTEFSIVPFPWRVYIQITPCHLHLCHNFWRSVQPLLPWVSVRAGYSIVDHTLSGGLHEVVLLFLCRQSLSNPYDLRFSSQWCWWTLQSWWYDTLLTGNFLHLGKACCIHLSHNGTQVMEHHYSWYTKCLWWKYYHKLTAHSASAVVNVIALALLMHVYWLVGNCHILVLTMTLMTTLIREFI